ncbi:MAG: HAD-IB family hydrolase [Gammaproteobacteria bacterium]|nr:MAG: HAD-IB family hydrolase [Gammaproteobacteria bacterium]RKZ97777.1 MAG: HAD-IB family hydrolase [Gammaproteobacteria bacterium]
MALVIFDLDNTLLGGDSDYLWAEFLVENKIVDGEHYRQTNQDFYDQYLAGTMDIFEFLAFQLKPLADNSLADLNRWRANYLAEKIEPIILPAGRALIAKHRQQGDTLLIITATNSFITTPIAEKLGIPYLIATEPEVINGVYTGKVDGTPSYQEGKVTRLQDWLDTQNLTLEGSYFYSDSHNDLPLLDLVEHPIAVDPDPNLQTIAQQRGWKIVSLRQ